MVRIAPGTMPTGPQEEDRRASGPDRMDDGGDGSSSDDESRETTEAATGVIRAGLKETGGSQEIANDKYAAAGTSVDTVVTGDDQPDVVASDTASGDKTVTAVVSEDVTGGDGGTGASIQTQTGKVDAGRPGDSSRVQEAVARAASSDDSTSDEPSPTGGDDSSQNGDSAAQQNPLLPSVPGGGGGGSILGGPGGLGSPGGSGGLMDTLTSPIGLVMVAVAAVALTFGGSQALEKEQEEDN